MCCSPDLGQDGDKIRVSLGQDTSIYIDLLNLSLKSSRLGLGWAAESSVCIPRCSQADRNLNRHQSLEIFVSHPLPLLVSRACFVVVRLVTLR